MVGRVKVTSDWSSEADERADEEEEESVDRRARFTALRPASGK